MRHVKQKMFNTQARLECTAGVSKKVFEEVNGCEDNGCRICGHNTEVVTNFPSYLGKTLRVNASITIQNKACSPKILVTAIPLLFFRKRSHPLLATASFSHYGNSL